MYYYAVRRICGNGRSSGGNSRFHQWSMDEKKIKVSEMKVLNVKDYGIFPGVKERKNTWYLRKMVEECEYQEATEIFFPAGEYHFYPDYAYEETLCISNHDADTVKRIVFCLKHLKNVTIRGEESLLIFHTEEIPFYLYQCENISIEGICIDYERPTFSEGIIRYVDEHRIRLYIDKEKYPWHIAHQRMFFTGENFCCELQFWLEMDKDTYAPVYGTSDLGFAVENPGYYGVWKEVGENLAEMTLDQENCRFFAASRVGNRVILRHHQRSHPAIYAVDSKNILLRQVSVYHAVGMGFLAELCENMELDQFYVTFHPEKKRPCTANADGIQMIYCSGKIHIHDCLFENQFDDPINIHGTYVRIHQILDSHTVLAELVHHQHKGAWIGKVGDRMEPVEHTTMISEKSGKITKLQWLNKDYLLLEFAEDMSHLRENMALENISRIPEILIENCIFRNNRARGLLLTTRGKTVVRKNLFQVPGSALFISGDCCDWFESGVTENILVEENVFDNCSYFPNWGKAPIQVEPSTRQTVEGKYYHQLLKISRNTFYCFDERIISAYNLKNLEFTENQIIRTHKYPAREGEAFSLRHVGNFREEKNSFKVFEEAE